MFLCLHKLENNIVLLFIIAFFTLSLWEYAVGVLLEKLFHTKYWDYSENKFNIKRKSMLIKFFILGIFRGNFYKIYASMD
jgi:uncharacterized membrane protein